MNSKEYSLCRFTTRWSFYRGNKNIHADRTIFTDFLNQQNPKYRKNKEIKRGRNERYYDRGKLYLEEALKEAKFYVNGRSLELNNKNFKFNVRKLKKASRSCLP